MHVLHHQAANVVIDLSDFLWMSGIQRTKQHTDNDTKKQQFFFNDDISCLLNDFQNPGSCYFCPNSRLVPRKSLVITERSVS